MDLFSLGNKPLQYAGQIASSLVKIAEILERLEKLLEEQTAKDN
jgi:hypothetical protein